MSLHINGGEGYRTVSINGSEKFIISINGVIKYAKMPIYLNANPPGGEIYGADVTMPDGAWYFFWREPVYVLIDTTWYKCYDDSTGYTHIDPPPNITLTYDTNSYYVEVNFLGWFTDPSEGIQITGSDGIVTSSGLDYINDTSNYNPDGLHLYAQWSEHIKVKVKIASATYTDSSGWDSLTSWDCDGDHAENGWSTVWIDYGDTAAAATAQISSLKRIEGAVRYAVDKNILTFSDDNSAHLYNKGSNYRGYSQSSYAASDNDLYDLNSRIYSFITLYPQFAPALFCCSKSNAYESKGWWWNSGVPISTSEIESHYNPYAGSTWTHHNSLSYNMCTARIAD